MVNRAKSQPATARCSRDASPNRKSALQRVLSPQPTKRQAARQSTQQRPLKTIFSQAAPTKPAQELRENGKF
jgi:hypothetical protein